MPRSSMPTVLCQGPPVRNACASQATWRASARMSAQVSSAGGSDALGVPDTTMPRALAAGTSMAAFFRPEVTRSRSPGVELRLEIEGDQARLRTEHEPRVAAMIEPVELLVASMAYDLPTMNDRMPRPAEICFAHARKHPPEVYAQLLGGPVRFEAGWSGLCFDAAALDLPVLPDGWSYDVVSSNYRPSVVGGTLSGLIRRRRCDQS